MMNGQRTGSKGGKGSEGHFILNLGQGNHVLGKCAVETRCEVREKCDITLRGSPALGLTQWQRERGSISPDLIIMAEFIAKDLAQLAICCLMSRPSGAKTSMTKVELLKLFRWLHLPENSFSRHVKHFSTSTKRKTRWMSLLAGVNMAGNGASTLYAISIAVASHPLNSGHGL